MLRTTGREALKALAVAAINALLLTDLHMPEMDGYDLTLQIRVGERGTRPHAHHRADGERSGRRIRTVSRRGHG